MDRRPLVQRFGLGPVSRPASGGTGEGGQDLISQNRISGSRAAHPRGGRYQNWVRLLNLSAWLPCCHFLLFPLGLERALALREVAW
jgi:hypothetical protein